MNQRDWNEYKDYLLNTRKYFWNDDYMHFLVKYVWKIDKPVNIIDFGCGFGYLGLKLLPILPEGSSYTGVDIATELLEQGNDLFEKSPYNYKFINSDLMEYLPIAKYDLAICQAVLRYIPRYDVILKKMIDSVVTDGTVVCMEVNRRIENAGLYVYGNENNIFQRDEQIMREWQNELENGGRDFLAASKVPVLMEKLGLSDVSVRVNDYVEYISPFQNDYDAHKKKFTAEHGWMIDGQMKDVYGMNMRGMLISFGTKRSQA